MVAIFLFNIPLSPSPSLPVSPSLSLSFSIFLPFSHFAPFFLDCLQIVRKIPFQIWSNGNYLLCSVSSNWCENILYSSQKILHRVLSSIQNILRGIFMFWNICSPYSMFDRSRYLRECSRVNNGKLVHFISLFYFSFSPSLFLSLQKINEETETRKETERKRRNDYFFLSNYFLVRTLILFLLPFLFIESKKVKDSLGATFSLSFLFLFLLRSRSLSLSLSLSKSLYALK